MSVRASPSPAAVPDPLAQSAGPAPMEEDMLSDAVPSNIVSRQVRVWRVGGLDHILTIAQPSNGASEEPEEAPEKDELESEGGQDVRRISSIQM